VSLLDNHHRYHHRHCCLYQQQVEFGVDGCPSAWDATQCLAPLADIRRHHPNNANMQLRVAHRENVVHSIGITAVCKNKNKKKEKVEKK